MNPKACKNCNACRRIYKRGNFSYWQNKMLYCSLIKEMTKAEGSCAHWSKKRAVYDLSSKRFDAVIADIRFLIAYFEGK